MQIQNNISRIIFITMVDIQLPLFQTECKRRWLKLKKIETAW